VLERERTGSIYAIMLAATSFVLSGNILQPVYALFIQDLGASLVQVGLLLSLRSFLPLILRIPLSLLAERVGRMRFIIADLVIAIITSVFYSYAQNYTHLIIIVLIEALAMGSFNQISMSTVSDAAPLERQGDAIGRYLTFLAAGMLLGPTLCAVLIAFMTYSQLFLLSASFPIFGIILLLFWAPRITRVEAQETEAPTIGTLDSLRMIFRNRNVILLSYCRTSFSAAQALFIALFSIYAEGLGISESTIALLFTIRGFVNTLARYPAGRISDRIGRKKPLIAAFGLIVVTYTILAFSRNAILFGLALALYGFSWGTRAVSEWAYLTDLVEPEIKTISISYLSSVFGIGGTLGSMFAGVLAATVGIPMVFLLAAGINLSAVPAIMAMGRDKG
jgi:predicted MFS family arabinose efflux permease